MSHVGGFQSLHSLDRPTWRNSMAGKTPTPLMLPLRRLSFTSSCVRELRLNSSAERLPLRSLKSRSKKMRLVKRPISVGIVEVRLPRSMPQIAKSVKKPISVGIVPTRLFSSVNRERERTGKTFWHRCQQDKKAPDPGTYQIRSQ